MNKIQSAFSSFLLLCLSGLPAHPAFAGEQIAFSFLENHEMDQACDYLLRDQATADLDSAEFIGEQSNASQYHLKIRNYDAVVKIYTSQIALEANKSALDTVRNLLKVRTKPLIEVIQIRTVNNLTSIQPYIEGAPLDEILKDPYTHSELKIQLAAKYQLLTAELLASVRNRMSAGQLKITKDSEKDFSSYVIQFLYQGPYGHWKNQIFTLHPKNIIVQKRNLKLFLVNARD